MAKPFDDPRHKVENAKEHIARVERAFNDYVASYPKVTENRGWNGMGPLVVNFGPQQPFPPKIPMAAGDGIHNLRSALDILAGDVVQASGESRKNVHFPFAIDAAGLEEQIKSKKFHRAAPEAIDLLRSLQPYKGGNGLLRALHDLDLTDKHNFIIPANNVHVVSNLRFGPEGITMDSVQSKLVFADEQPLAGKEVIPTLHALSELVSDIIEAFAQLFRSGSDPASGGPPG